jgi:hypothetical protein
VSRRNVVWVSPGATSFSCLCEECLDDARRAGSSFIDAVRGASVRGRVSSETDVAFACCQAGHEVVVRRNDRPAPLPHRDLRQLQIV